MKNFKINTAIIGLGRIGFTLGLDNKREQPASHTMALLQNKNINLIAGCDVDPEKVSIWDKYVKRYNKNILTYTDPSKMLIDKKYDLIVIAVNEDSHLDITLKAVKSSPKLIILEKPVALNMEQAEQIKQVSKQFNVPILVNHERRFAKDYNIAKKMLSKIGEIQTVNARLDSGMCVYNSQKETNGAYSLLHDGTHLVDIVMFLLEDSTDEQSTLQNMKIISYYQKPEEKDIIRNLSVHYECGKCKDVNFNFSGRSKFFGFEVDIIGTLGRIIIGNDRKCFLIRKESKLYTGFYSLFPIKNIFNFKKTYYFSNMLQNGVDYLMHKQELKSTLSTGIKTLYELECIKKELILNLSKNNQ